MKNEVSHDVITSISLMCKNTLCLTSVKNLLQVILKDNEFYCLATRCLNREPAFEVLYWLWWRRRPPPLVHFSFSDNPMSSNDQPLCACLHLKMYISQRINSSSPETSYLLRQVALRLFLCYIAKGRQSLCKPSQHILKSYISPSRPGIPKRRGIIKIGITYVLKANISSLTELQWNASNKIAPDKRLAMVATSAICKT